MSRGHAAWGLAAGALRHPRLTESLHDPVDPEAVIFYATRRTAARLEAHGLTPKQARQAATTALSRPNDTSRKGGRSASAGEPSPNAQRAGETTDRTRHLGSHASRDPQCRSAEPRERDEGHRLAPPSRDLRQPPPTTPRAPKP